MNLFEIAGLSTAVFCLLLAMIALIYGQTRLHFLLMLFNIVVSIWGSGTFLVGKATSISSALSAWKLACAGGLFIPILFYHIVCIFAELNRRKYIILAYLQGFIFLYLMAFTDLVINKTRLIFDSIYYNDATRIFYLIILIWLSIVFSSFYELYRYLNKVKGYKRQETLYLFFGTLVGFVGGTSTLLPMFGIDFYPMGNFTIPIYCFITTYAILKYRFMNIKIDILNFSIIAIFLTSLLGIPLGLALMNPFAASGLLLGVTCLLLALVVFLQGNTKLHRIWTLFNLAVAIWGIGCYLVGKASTESYALFGWRFAHVGGIFVAIFFYNMVCTFCDLKRKKSISAGYSIGLSSLLLNLFTDKFINKTRLVFDLFYNDATWLYSIILVLWLSLVAWGFVELLRFFPKTQGIKRTQTIYIILGFLTGFSGGVSTFLPEFKIDAFYPFGNFTIPLYCLIVTYAILRYRLMDINVVIKKTTVYSLSAGLLGSFFVVFVLATTKYLTDYLRISSFAIMAFAAVVIALLFNPVRNRIQKVIDKIFYKKTYDYYSIIQKVSHKLVSTFSPRGIYSFVGDTISSAFGLKNFYMLSLYPDEKYRVVHSISSEKRDETKKEASGGDKDSVKKMPDTGFRMQAEEKIINEKSEVVNLLKKLKDVVIREELPQMPGISQEVSDRVNTELKPFKGEAVVPVFIDGKLELIMVLSEKQSGDIFTDEDVKLLNTISDQTAIAVKNARLYLEKVRSERLASIGIISATFAHEIKNPLTSIKTFAQLLPERYSDTDFRENFSRLVIDGVNRIDGLIKDLLDFSSGKISVELSPVNVTEIMDKVVDEVMTQIQLKDRKIEIEKDYKDIEIDMMGDGKRLRQAFLNIILNACQAIPETRDDGKITVSINPGEENVGILIADNGEGIPPEDLPRIFEPFFSKKTVGAGLGLAITKKIIEDHYGKIEVNSILKKGTIFKITLPIKKIGAKVANLSTA